MSEQQELAPKGAKKTLASISRIASAIRGHAYAFQDESDLQEGIAAALGAADFSYLREHRLSPKDRIDFFLFSLGIGVEAKIDGGISALTRQLHRYAQSDEIVALLVVTSRFALATLPPTLNGQPVRATVIARGLR